MSSAIASRVAIVTGASRGIGRAIALRLAKDGFNVAINDLPSAEPTLEEVGTLISKFGRRALVCSGDVSVEADVKHLISNVADKLGGVDVMVANAGVCFYKSLADTSVEDWDKTFSINARGVFLCYKYASEQMIKQGRGGKMIGATSIAGKRGFPGLATYSGTKFAVRGLTQSIAQELVQHGITVNAYAPGPIETNMLETISELTQNMGHGTPDDVAGLVSYLASSESRFMTGQSVTLDGGQVFD